MPTSPDGYIYLVVDGYIAIGNNSTDYYNGFNNPNVQSLNVPSTIDGLIVKRVLYRAFASLTSLTSIILPTTLEIVDGDLLLGCTNLKAVYFQEPSILRDLSIFAFCNCYSLEQITLPRFMRYIGRSTFAGCAALKHIFVPTNDCSFDADFNKNGNPNVVVHVSKCFMGSAANALLSKSLDCVINSHSISKQHDCALIIIFLLFIL